MGKPRAAMPTERSRRFSSRPGWPPQLLAGCGDDGGGSGGGGGSDVAAERAADAEILNVAISQELTLVEAY